MPQPIPNNKNVLRSGSHRSSGIPPTPVPPVNQSAAMPQVRRVWQASPQTAQPVAPAVASTASNVNPSQSRLKKWVVGCLAVIGALTLACVIISALALFIGAQNPSTSTTNNISTASSYRADIPGPDCDNGNGTWIVSDSAQVTCTSSELQVKQASDQYLATVALKLPSQTIPADSSVTVDIDFPASNTCAGILTRSDGDRGGYGFQVCDTGSWYICNYSASDGTCTQVNSGQVDSSSVVTLLVVSNGADEAMSLNGSQVSTFTDSTFTQTNEIDLIVDKGTAGFSNFGFTALHG